MHEDVMKIKYLLYARKSSESEDRQVLSIDSQIDELRLLIERHGLELDEIRSEAYSAKAPGRPVFNKMLDDIESGKTQGIIVWNPDRLSRNSMDTGRLIYLFDLGKLKEIFTPSQTFKNTPNDKFLLNLLCSQAKLENDNKGINVKRGLKAKAERGIYPAPAPLGYLNDRYAERGNKTIVKDPERFDMIRKMFDLMLTGRYSALQVRDVANEQWGFRTPNDQKLGRSSIYNIFTRPFYYGMFEYPVNSGIWHKAIHTPMITVEEYDRIQTLLGRDGKPRPQGHLFSFTGMMRCDECQCQITAEEKTKKQQNGNIHHYIYYHCTKKKDPNCRQKSIEEKELKKQILKTLDEVEIPDDFHEWAMKWFQKTNQKESFDTHKILAHQQKAFKECADKIDALIDMRAAHEINQEQFRTRMAKLEKEKARLDELLADTSKRMSNWLKKADEWFSLARDGKTEFANGDMDTRRRILSNLGSNLLLRDKKLSITIEKPLLLLKKASKEVKRIKRGLEPRGNGVTKEQLHAIYSRSPRLLRGQDSNLEPSP